MRLGSQRVLLTAGSRIAEIYGRTEIWERHRHRYEINPAYFERLEAAGLRDQRGARSTAASRSSSRPTDRSSSGSSIIPSSSPVPRLPTRSTSSSCGRPSPARRSRTLSAPRRLSRELATRNGEAVRVAGHLEDYRALGGVAFALVRDRSGTTQVTLKKGVADPALFALFAELPRESVVAVEGTGPALAEGEPGRRAPPRPVWR